MVFDVAMIVSLATSGLCCLWQEKSDEQTREGIRNDIRAEYWKHRIIEQELYERRKQEQNEMFVGQKNMYHHQRNVDLSSVGRSDHSEPIIRTMYTSRSSTSSGSSQASLLSNITNSNESIRDRLRRQQDYFRIMGYNNNQLVSLADVETDDDDDDLVQEDESSLVDIPL